MKLDSLTQQDVNEVSAKCLTIENLYHEADDGSIELRPDVSETQLRAANRGLVATLESLSNDAMVELQALMWIGRGDDVADDISEVIDYSRSCFDDSSRGYISGKAPLRTYIADGIEKSGVELASQW